MSLGEMAAASTFEEDSDRKKAVLCLRELLWPAPLLPLELFPVDDSSLRDLRRELLAFFGVDVFKLLPSTRSSALRSKLLTSFSFSSARLARVRWKATSCSSSFTRASADDTFSSIATLFYTSVTREIETE